jgi:hypothetical protein
MMSQVLFRCVRICSDHDHRFQSLLPALPRHPFLDGREWSGPHDYYISQLSWYFLCGLAEATLLSGVEFLLGLVLTLGKEPLNHFDALFSQVL